MSDEYTNPLGLVIPEGEAAGGEISPTDAPDVPDRPGTTYYLRIKSNDGTEELYTSAIYSDSAPVPAGSYLFFDGSVGSYPIGVYTSMDPIMDEPTMEVSLEGYLGLTSILGGQTPTVADGTILAIGCEPVISDVIYYAIPKPPGYAVTYSTAHGTTPSPAHELFELTASELPALTSEGREFLGWFYEDTFETQAQIGDALEADITLYAKWEETQNIINAAALADSLKVTADAIRSRGVDGLQIFDMENRTGFKEAIELIPRGGQYIKVSDTAPTSDEGIDGDIWIVVSS